MLGNRQLCRGAGGTKITLRDVIRWTATGSGNGGGRRQLSVRKTAHKKEGPKGISCDRHEDFIHWLTATGWLQNQRREPMKTVAGRISHLLHLFIFEISKPLRLQYATTITSGQLILILKAYLRLRFISRLRNAQFAAHARAQGRRTVQLMRLHGANISGHLALMIQQFAEQPWRQV